ncbi:hypothetical protein [Aestuariivivens sediminis]|uniref:hypothetical protein n=1 Tax=Aestuariivivens sediminis TaxID=2913557 RepID=UPI001F596679|nr:hypothetical protein [Aestuariivivens sediminis]
MKTSIMGILFIWLLHSCGAHRVYTSGTYGSLKSYTEKQHYVDKKSTKTYVSGDVSFGKHMQDAGTFDDSKTIASILVHRNTSGRFYNYYYGLGAGFGNYRFNEGYKDIVKRNEKASFYNINFKTGINYALTRPKIDYRFIGLELSYYNEFGNYQKKLEALSKLMDEGLIIVNQKSMFTYTIYSEYVIKFSHEEAMTLGFYVGELFNKKTTQDYSYGYDTVFNGLTVGLRLHKYTFHLIYETGENEIRSTKLGLTYQF